MYQIILTICYVLELSNKDFNYKELINKIMNSKIPE